MTAMRKKRLVVGIWVCCVFGLLGWAPAMMWWIGPENVGRFTPWQIVILFGGLIGWGAGAGALSDYEAKLNKQEKGD